MVSNLIPPVSLARRKPQSAAASASGAEPPPPPCLLLTDARCLPGSEGGAAIDRHTGHLIGMVTVPLRHVAVGSTVEFNFVISTDSLYHWFNSAVTTAAATAVAATATPSSIAADLSSANRISGGGNQPVLSVAGASAANSGSKRSAVPYQPVTPPILRSAALHPLNARGALQRAVELAERSLVVVRMGVSWASAIVISGDGCT